MVKKNIFSQDSSVYATSRPTYPPALFNWIFEHCRNYRNAWDCATGNGQAAIALSDRFERVFATDISEEQLQQAKRASNVEYTRSPAEDSGFEVGQFDLVVVAQALHWFDFKKFWNEVSRVASKDAFFCACGYAWMSTESDLDQKFIEEYRQIISSFWASNNKILWDGYQSDDIAFPAKLTRLAPPEFSIELSWTFDQLASYMSTWSASKRCFHDQLRGNALESLVSKVRRSVDPDHIFNVRMPLSLVAAKLDKN